MTQAHNVRVSARTAELTAADEDGGGYSFGGIAVGEDDILYTDDGTPVIFTPEVLAEYAETQSGEPLSVDHPSDEDGEPIYPPPVDETPGTVPKAGYVPGKGLGYEANTHDETIANGVKAGSYDVSVHPTFDLTDEQDPDTGAYIPTNVEFLDLSVVSKGMSPSNTAEWGPNAALASWTRQADIGAEIEAQTTPDMPESEGEILAWFRKMAQKAGLTAQADPEDSRLPQAGDSVRWNSDAGGETEPSDVRYGVVVDGLQDESDDVVLVAVYQPTSDGGGWENRNEQNTMQRENLEVVGSDGVESLPAVSQVTASAEAPDESNGNEPAESGVDADLESTMEDDTREEYVDFITENGDFGEESLEAMDDSTLETTHELVAAAADDGDEGDGTDEEPDEESNDAGESQTLADMTTDELGSALREQGFVTEDDATEVVEQATAQKNKSEKVDEIIARSETYDEDDREDLMASADKIVESEYDRLTTTGTGASLPGTSSTRSQVAASADAEDDLDAYGTGVQD